MKLKKLLHGAGVKSFRGEDIEISGIENDSRLVKPGYAYVALKGAEDGAKYIQSAIKNGAVAIIGKEFDYPENSEGISFITVDDARKTFSVMAANFYDNPQKKLKITGVTGTNGKTTVTYMISHILSENGIKTGIIGTNGVMYDGNVYDTGMTTPDPTKLFYYLGEMVKSGVETVVMEVSAHAAFYDKIYGIDFFAGVFTNFTQDHLDFFKDEESYKKAKLKFLNNYNCKYIVANADDKLTGEIKKKNKKVLTYGIKNPSDVFAMDLRETLSGEKFILNVFDEIYDMDTRFYGEFNVYNALAACEVCSIYGIKIKDIAASLKTFCGVPGRMEKIYENEFSVFIDYAHTPDGLRNALETLRPITENKLILVFGCGGNRDALKRPIMGEIASDYADISIITSDNPRFEEPFEIIRQIEKGFKKGKYRVVVYKRQEAIEYALKIALKGDVVLIAGKGAEKYQEVLGVKRDFDDKKVALGILYKTNAIKKGDDEAEGKAN